MDWKAQLKQAAAQQEQVDYTAVAKTFMDQAYGFVANKAKPLFAEQHRLGFEIVRRNEKATRMVGIFAFRVDRSLLYAPVFFVNGDIRPVDMLYRSDVKRFCPLTEEWCAFLTEGANQEAGRAIEKGRTRQPDGHIDRLAYPQMRKYASNTDGAMTAYDEMLKLANAFDAPVELLLPRLVKEAGYEILEKLGHVEDSPQTMRALAEFYDMDSFDTIKEAAEELEENSGELLLVNDLLQTKSAAEHNRVRFDGYTLRDTRPDEAKAVVIDASEDIETISRPGVYEVMLHGGDLRPGVLVLREKSKWLGEDGFSGGDFNGSARYYKLYCDGCYKSVCARDSLHGVALPSAEVPELVDHKSLSAGDVVAVVDLEAMATLGEFKVTAANAESISLSSRANGERPVQFFFSDQLRRVAVDGRAFGPGLRFLKLKADTGENYHVKAKDFDGAIMTSLELDNWIRTAGDTAKSQKVVVRGSEDGYNILVNQHKAAKDLSKKEAHVALSLRLGIDAAIAEAMIEDGRDRLVFQREKSAFMTRVDPAVAWTELRDPIFGHKVETPETQVLSTTTPRRHIEHASVGDRYEVAPRRGMAHKLSEDVIFSSSPEQLAELSRTMDLPAIFDHGVVGQLAGSVFDAVSQIDGYIPDLENGLDRIFRTLFLIRYRPAEFEEAFGREEILETEQEFAEIGRMLGEAVLKMIRRHKGAR